jgi:hypothetical protein
VTRTDGGRPVIDKLLLVMNFLFDELGLPRRLVFGGQMMSVGFLTLTGFDLGVTAFSRVSFYAVVYVAELVDDIA